MKKFLYLICFCFTISLAASGQDSLRHAGQVAVLGRPSGDSIMLRWAPLNFAVWNAGNKSGYTIQRFTVTRNGRMISPPEAMTLTAQPLKPWAEMRWESLVKRDKYGAIAAQALFGEKFELDLSKSDVFSIVNKVRENEQRYAFALFSADMSPGVAEASGLFFVDRNVRKGEKYLYRIQVNGATDTLQGSIFISPDDPYIVPAPENLKVTAKERLVSLKWDKAVYNSTYTAYLVERSADGKSFAPVSDLPLTTFAPDAVHVNAYEYATDSLPALGMAYHYRVRGITPFGEKGPPSENVTVTGVRTTSEIPYIKSGENIDNKSIRIGWEFSESENAAIKGFKVQRSEVPDRDFRDLHQEMLPTSTRSYEDKAPNQINYYRVRTETLDGEVFTSPIYLAQLVDSIPPAAPAGLQAKISESGEVALTWQPNSEKDIYGYRIYRANVKSEEFAQVTTGPVPAAMYQDKVNLQTLNKFVYYRVMAIDRNQNHSGLSEILAVPLPDKIKPQPPVFLPVRSGNEGVALQWERSASDDVARYDLYRKSGEEKQWVLITSVPVTGDTLYSFMDKDGEARKQYHYTLITVDRSGLESEPAQPVTGVKIMSKLPAPVRWKDPQVDRSDRSVTLSWTYEDAGVKAYQIYRSAGDGAKTLYKTVAAGDKRFTDRLLIVGTTYRYSMLTVFENGVKSSLSKEITIDF